MEKIKHAAIKVENGWVMMGRDHEACYLKAKNIGLTVSCKADDQGFITNKGRYVDRSLAAKISIESGQIDKLVPVLCSEDIWSDEYNGKYNYSEIEGYIPKQP